MWNIVGDMHGYKNVGLYFLDMMFGLLNSAAEAHEPQHGTVIHLLL